MTDWEIGQFVRVWRNEGYEYGHIETIESFLLEEEQWNSEVMLVGDDGRQIYCRVKDLEEGE